MQLTNKLSSQKSNHLAQFIKVMLAHNPMTPTLRPISKKNKLAACDFFIDKDSGKCLN